MPTFPGLIAASRVRSPSRSVCLRRRCPFVLVLEIHRQHGLRERVRAPVRVPGQREEAESAPCLPQLPQQVEPARLLPDQVSDPFAAHVRLSARPLVPWAPLTAGALTAMPLCCVRDVCLLGLFAFRRVLTRTCTVLSQLQGSARYAQRGCGARATAALHSEACVSAP